MASLRLWGISTALALGFLLVLGAPVWLLYVCLAPPAWDPQAVEVRFEWLRAENDIIVFAYQLQNTTGRPVRIPAEVATVRLLQAGDMRPAGKAAIELPRDLAPYSSQRVEVRLELPHPWATASGNNPQPVMNATGDMAPLAEEAVRNALHGLQGFELTIGDTGVQLMLPRGW